MKTTEAVEIGPEFQQEKETVQEKEREEALDRRDLVEIKDSHRSSLPRRIPSRPK